VAALAVHRVDYDLLLLCRVSFRAYRNKIVSVWIHWELVLQGSLLKVDALVVARVHLNHPGTCGWRQDQRHCVLDTCTSLRIDTAQRGYLDLEAS
jgi:hypothetical protein